MRVYAHLYTAHFDDMKKTNLSKQFLKDAKNRFIVRFIFKVMAYYGKYNLSKKAVDIELVKIEPLQFANPGAGTIDTTGLEMQMSQFNLYG